MAADMSTATKHDKRNKSSVEECIEALGEAHDEGVYNAIERLVQAGEQVGLTVQGMVRLLENGMSLESLLDLIEVRMMRIYRAGA